MSKTEKCIGLAVTIILLIVLGLGAKKLLFRLSDKPLAEFTLVNLSREKTDVSYELSFVSGPEGYTVTRENLVLEALEPCTIEVAHFPKELSRPITYHVTFTSPSGETVEFELTSDEKKLAIEYDGEKAVLSSNTTGVWYEEGASASEND